MKKYNAQYRKNKSNRLKIDREEEYRTKPFYMHPRQPHILTMSDVARLLHKTLPETRELYTNGDLILHRMHNGYPRFFSGDVFAMVERHPYLKTDVLEVYKEDLEHHKTLKDTDPERYAELCARLRKGRDSLKLKVDKSDNETENEGAEI